MLFVSGVVNHLLMLDAVGLSYCQSNANSVPGRLASGEHDAFNTVKSRGALGELDVEGVLFSVVLLGRRLEREVTAE